MAARITLALALGLALALPGCGGGGGGGGGGGQTLAQITQALQACAQGRTAEMLRLLDTGAGVLLGRVGTLTPDPPNGATFNAPFDLNGDGTDDATFSGSLLFLSPGKTEVTWALTGAATGSGVFVVEGDLQLGIATVTGNGTIRVGTCDFDILLPEPFPLQLSLINFLPQPLAVAGGANLAGTAAVVVMTPGHQMSTTLQMSPDSNDVHATEVVVDEMAVDDFVFTLPGMDAQAVERVSSCLFVNTRLFFTLFNNLTQFAEDGDFEALLAAGYVVDILGLNVFRVTGPLGEGFTVVGTIELSGLPVLDYTGTARISYDITNEDQTVTGTSGDTPLFMTFDGGSLETIAASGTFTDSVVNCVVSFFYDDSVMPIPVQFQVTTSDDNFQAGFEIDDSGPGAPVIDVLNATYNGTRVPDSLALILLQAFLF